MWKVSPVVRAFFSDDGLCEALWDGKFESLIFKSRRVCYLGGKGGAPAVPECGGRADGASEDSGAAEARSEEHTSELQSQR